jgi:hypothetical protein
MLSTEQTSPMTGARQTMSTWSRQIESIEDVPGDFQELFNTLPDTGNTFPYTVFAPRITQLLHRNPENVICDTDGTWHIIKNSGGEIELTSYPVQHICDIELGQILLYSWITVNGQTLDGKTASSSIEFNAATARFYDHFFDQFKPAPPIKNDVSLETEQAKFDSLASSTFKFMNYASNSITAGEEIIQFIWQPEIRVPRLPFLHLPFLHTVTTAHLLILTDKQVIVLRDDERSQLNKDRRYGGVRHFIPLHNILTSSLEQKENLLVFRLKLCDDRHVEWLFAETHRKELEKFQNLLNQHLTH